MLQSMGWIVSPVAMIYGEFSHTLAPRTLVVIVRSDNCIAPGHISWTTYQYVKWNTFLNYLLIICCFIIFRLTHSAKYHFWNTVSTKVTSSFVSTKSFYWFSDSRLEGEILFFILHTTIYELQMLLILYLQLNEWLVSSLLYQSSRIRLCHSFSSCFLLPDSFASDRVVLFEWLEYLKVYSLLRDRIYYPSWFLSAKNQFFVYCKRYTQYAF